jgi:hypothetical protein
MTPNHALEPTAASGLRALAVPLSLRSSAAAQRERLADEKDVAAGRTIGKAECAGAGS